MKRFSLPDLMDLYQAKYKHVTVFHVIKSMTYFEEAEPDPPVQVFEKKVTWEIVKKTISKAVQAL